MKNIPNILTIFRIFLSVLVMIIILYGDMHNSLIRYSACAIFSLATITDFLDGFLARFYGAQSRFGEIFDPLADKMLVLGALIALLVVGFVSPWAVFLVLSREFLVMGLRAVVATHQVNLSADMLGKTKSVLQYWAIGCLIAQIFSPFWNQIFLWLAVALTLISGLNYARNYFKSLL